MRRAQGSGEGRRSYRKREHPDTSNWKGGRRRSSRRRVSSLIGTKGTGSTSSCPRADSLPRTSTSVWPMSPSSHSVLLSPSATPSSLHDQEPSLSRSSPHEQEVVPPSESQRRGSPLRWPPPSLGLANNTTSTLSLGDKLPETQSWR